LATKLKKSKLYSKGMKAFAVFLVYISVIIITLCGLGILWISDGIGGHFDGFVSIEYDDYTDTHAFRESFDELSDTAIKVNLVYKSEGNIREGKAVDEDELIAGFKQYYNIVDGVITDNTIINDDYKVEITGKIPEEKLVNFNEYETLVNTKLRDYKNMYIQNQLNDYIDKKVEIDSYVNYYFCIENADGSYIAGNTSKDHVLSLKQYIVLNGEFLSDKMDLYSGYKNKTIADSNYKFYAGIPDAFYSGDEFYENSQDFYLRKQLYPVMMSTMLALTFFVVILVGYLMRVCGQDMARGEVTKHAIDRIYNEFHFMIVFAAAALSLVGGTLMGAVMITYKTDVWFLIWGAVLLVLVLIDTTIGLNYLCSLSRHIKAGTFFSHTFVASVLRKIGATLSGKSFSGWIITLFVGYTLIICLTTAIIMQSFSHFQLYGESFFTVLMFFVILLCVIIIATMLVVRGVKSLSRIMYSARRGANGHFDKNTIDVSKTSAVFADFADDINNMQKGLKQAVEEAVKGERMKTDLITNVSHDLKTPLTSIISYANLLENTNLENEEAEKYVDIILDKSVRLKHLIEDLIEASKVSSGNISVEKTKINYKQLVIQACGEYEEKFENVNLEMRISAEDDVLIYADGNHMWRIIDNLLSNVLKYAMEKTRVYIDVYKEGTKGVFVIKNTSKHEINYNIQNLTERFFRGDEARSTEGSGLGLSIANSLAEVQNGDFEIGADGDLFKVMVKMPLWIEENIYID